MKKSKQTVRLNKSQLRKMIKESLNEFIGGIRPGARYGNKNFNVKTLINEVEIALNEIDRQCDYLTKLSSQLPGDVFNNNFDSELNRYANNIGALNQELTNKFWESIKYVQIAEEVKKSIKKVLNESFNNIEVGTCSKEADPEGLLDGVTDIEFEERCGTDLFIVFDKSQLQFGSTLSSVLLVKRREDASKDEIRQYEQDRRRYWAVFGSRILDTLLLYVS